MSLCRKKGCEPGFKRDNISPKAWLCEPISRRDIEYFGAIHEDEQKWLMSPGHGIESDSDPRAWRRGKQMEGTNRFLLKGELDNVGIGKQTT